MHYGIYYMVLLPPVIIKHAYRRSNRSALLAGGRCIRILRHKKTRRLFSISYLGWLCIGSRCCHVFFRTTRIRVLTGFSDGLRFVLQYFSRYSGANDGQRYGSITALLCRGNADYHSWLCRLKCIGSRFAMPGNFLEVGTS